jgi:hypothetical protein
VSGADGELAQALTDFHRGMALAGRLEPGAERLLASAYPVLRKYPSAANQTQRCEHALQMLLLPTDALRLLLGLRAEEPSADAGSLLTLGLTQAGSGDVPAALATLAVASRAATAVGDDDEAHVINGYRAMMALRAAPVDASARRLAEHTVAALGDRLARLSPIQPEIPDLFRHLRAELARLDGDAEAAVALLADQEAAELAAGWGHLAAETAVRRAKLLLDLGRVEDAVEVAVPAVLALDAVRFELPEAARRHRSLPVDTALGYHTAFAAAAACGEHRIIAELIEVVRGNAVPRPRTAIDRADAPTALYGGVDPLAAATRTLLPPPAAIRTPWQTVAVAEYLRQAERYLPGRRTDSEVEWRVVSVPWVR